MEARACQRRRQAKQQARRKRGEQREEQNRSVNSNRRELWKIVQVRFRKRREPKPGQNQTAGSAEQRENQGFRKQLADESGSARTNRYAHRQFPLAHRIARQK